MRYQRSFRRTGRSLGRIVQGFKNVINIAPASVAAGKADYVVVTGQDNIAAGQTTATDSNVPTGSIIKQIEFQFPIANLVSIASFVDVSIQHLRTGQGSVDPLAVGGNAQRNQVHWQRIYSVGKDQNRDIVKVFKVPKKFQRVREGDRWLFTVNCNTISTQTLQCVYKYYR